MGWWCSGSLPLTGPRRHHRSGAPWPRSSGLTAACPRGQARARVSSASNSKSAATADFQRGDVAVARPRSATPSRPSATCAARGGAGRGWSHSHKVFAARGLAPRPKPWSQIRSRDRRPQRSRGVSPRVRACATRGRRPRLRCDHRPGLATSDGTVMAVDTARCRIPKRSRRSGDPARHEQPSPIAWGHRGRRQTWNCWSSAGRLTEQLPRTDLDRFALVRILSAVDQQARQAVLPGNRLPTLQTLEPVGHEGHPRRDDPVDPPTP